jgi:acetyl esterase/lipase
VSTKPGSDLRQEALRGRLDPDTARYLAGLAASGAVPVGASPLNLLRQGVNARSPELEGPGRNLPEVVDEVVELPGRPVTVRLYRPADGDLPILVYLHGGGFISGSLLSHDALAETWLPSGRGHKIRRPASGRMRPIPASSLP